jgi:hypothetical protein
MARFLCYETVMQVAKRRFIVISAIAIGGAVAGLALGNFVAGAPKITGIDELAAYNAMFDSMEEAPATEVVSRPSLDERDGPTSYHCEGCDARRYDDRIEGAAADTTPLPPYLPEEPVALSAVPATPPPLDTVPRTTLVPVERNVTATPVPLASQ